MPPVPRVSQGATALLAQPDPLAQLALLVLMELPDLLARPDLSDPLVLQALRGLLVLPVQLDLPAPPDPQAQLALLVLMELPDLLEQPALRVPLVLLVQLVLLVPPAPPLPLPPALRWAISPPPPRCLRWLPP